MAAARALGSLEHAAARPALEAAIQGKRLKAADRSEKIAYFEALGRVGGAEAVPFLDKLLNGRGWLGRGETSEIRACAALGLARVRHPSARNALETAAADPDPVVRTAVARSLRGEGA
jgi:HEAT repeat protein